MPEAIQGHDDFLFLANDSNAACDQYAGKHVLSEQDAFQIYFVHQSRMKFLRDELGVPYQHIIVPNKEAVLHHLVPDSLKFQQEGLTPLNTFFETISSLENSTFYRPNLLRKLHAKELAFSRTDTHWTHYGALNYLIAALDHAGLEDAAKQLRDMPLAINEVKQVGDLGSKCGIEFEMVRSYVPKIKGGDLVMTNGIANEGCVRVFKNDAPLINKKLLIMHDSTAFWIIEYLRTLFAEVMMIHYPDFDPLFAYRYKPDAVLFMQIERFFIRAPKNDVSWAAIADKEEKRKGATKSAVPFINEVLGV